MNTTKKVRNKAHSQSERDAHLAQWKNSGLSMSGYCRRMGLSVSSLSTWNKQSIQKNPTFKPVLSSSLVKDQPTSSISHASCIEMIFPSGMKVRLLGSTRLSDWIPMIKALESCS